MELILILLFSYLLYRFGRWLQKIFKKLTENSVSEEEYYEDLINNALESRGDPSRLSSLIEENQELEEKKRLRKAIEDELNIKM